jgi:hypothetical protein
MLPSEAEASSLTAVPGFPDWIKGLDQKIVSGCILTDIREPEWESWSNTGEHMRQAVSLALALLMVGHLGPAAFGAVDVRNQVTGMPTGTNIEVRLKNKQTLRGARGEVSESGFTLVDQRAGNRQIAFDEVTSVKQLVKKSHTMRNVLIVVGIAVVIVAVVVVVKVKQHPLGSLHLGNLGNL